ncbi:MAG: HEAT repeat domain-containing protein [Planctomycetes bacterium]|nr:HEAT repeat domain-containing protein [Planctomycetota bacterium]
MFLVPLLAYAALIAPSSQSDEPVVRPVQPLALDERGYPAELVREIATIVRRARDPKAEERPRLAAALGKLGSRAFDPLLDLLEVRKVPVVVAGQRVQTLSVYQEDIVLEGLRALGTSNALRHMDRRLAEHGDKRRRLAALALFGRLGERDRLAKLFELAEPEADQPVDRDLEDELRESLAELLRREPFAVPKLNLTWRSVSKELLPTAIFALGDVRDGRGLALAVDAAALHPELLPLTAAQVAVIGRSPDADSNRRAILHLRDALDSAEGHVACGVVRALAVLEDDGSVQRWIELLTDESESLRSAAHWSLVHLSKLEYSPTPELWQYWWDGEQAWFDTQYEPLLADLESPDAGKVTAALRALATRHVRRHDIAREITRVLSDERPALRKLACDVLRELGSIDALPELALARLDEDPEVARAAWNALGSLSGRAFELESPEWEALVAAREP